MKIHLIVEISTYRLEWYGEYTRPDKMDDVDLTNYWTYKSHLGSVSYERYHGFSSEFNRDEYTTVGFWDKRFHFGSKEIVPTIEDGDELDAIIMIDDILTGAEQSLALSPWTKVKSKGPVVYRPLSGKL